MDKQFNPRLHLDGPTKLVLEGPMVIYRDHDGDRLIVGGRDFDLELGIFDPTHDESEANRRIVAVERYGDMRITVERIGREPVDRRQGAFLEILSRKLARKRLAKGGPGW